MGSGSSSSVSVEVMSWSRNCPHCKACSVIHVPFLCFLLGKTILLMTRGLVFRFPKEKKFGRILCGKNGKKECRFSHSECCSLFSPPVMLRISLRSAEMENECEDDFPRSSSSTSLGNSISSSRFSSSVSLEFTGGEKKYRLLSGFCLFPDSGS